MSKIESNGLQKTASQAKIKQTGKIIHVSVLANIDVGWGAQCLLELVGKEKKH